MGAVWMADQTEPVKRRVAVKLIRADRGTSKSILARFEAERQAIALMDHPNIAKLLDAGTTEDGQPYFVMDLVKGIPVTEYCDAHRLSIHDRLGLFVQICSAVQHAHQKGIIHRDIKPSNILVESHDGKPVPKIIDFGLAKATSGMQLSENTLFTGFGNVLGTPLYMAPEQANFNAVDIDTRADVYALGVILYELLTGTTPLTRETVKKAAIDEMLKLIREQDAPTPSSRLSTSESKPSIAANRHTEPDKLGRFVKGELDWIVMKALSKERDRRYETANGFAKDIERFLGNEPVQAGPPSVSYKFSKFVRRNRSQVVAASFILLALLGGIVGTTWGLVEARRQQGLSIAAAEAERQAKSEANLKREEAEGQKLRAEAGEQLARERLTQVESEKQIVQAVKDFLHKKLLSQSSDYSQAETLLSLGEPIERLRANPTIRELLDRAALELTPEAIEVNFPNQTLVQAELLATVGESYVKINEFSRGLQMLERAIEIRKRLLRDDHADVLETRNLIALAHFLNGGDMTSGVSELETVLSSMKPSLGENDKRTLEAMMCLATGYFVAGRMQESRDLLTDLVNRAKSNLDDNRAIAFFGMYLLSRSFAHTQEYVQALEIADEAKALADSTLGLLHPLCLELELHIAYVHSRLGHAKVAIPMAEKAIEKAEASLGKENPRVIEKLNTLAGICTTHERFDLAIPVLERTLDAIERQGISASNPQLLTTLKNLGFCYKSQKQFEIAIPIYLRFFTGMKLRKESATLNIYDVGLRSQSMDAAIELSDCYKETNQLKLATPLLELALSDMQSMPTEDSLKYHAKILRLVDAYCEISDFDSARKLVEAWIETQVSHSVDPKIVFASQIWLFRVHLRAKNFDTACALAKQLVAIGKGQLDIKPFYNVEYMIGTDFRKNDRSDLAIPYFDSVAETLENLNFDLPETRSAMINLVSSLEDISQFEKAEILHRKWLNHLKSTTGDASTEYAKELTWLAKNLLSQRKPAEAEELLRNALAIRKSQSPESWSTFNSMSTLGDALLDLKKYAEAEPLLLQGYEGMKAREKNMSNAAKQRIPEAFDRIVKLYNMTDNPNEAAKWKAEREKRDETHAEAEAK